MPLTLLFRLADWLVVQVLLCLTLSGQTDCARFDHALLDDLRVVLGNRMFLNKSLLLFLKELSNLVGLADALLWVDSSLNFQALHHSSRLSLFGQYLCSDLTFIRGFAQTCEFSHCLVKHGQKLICV